MTDITLAVPDLIAPFFEWAAILAALIWTIWQHFQHKKTTMDLKQQKSITLQFAKEILKKEMLENSSPKDKKEDSVLIGVTQKL